VLLVLAPTLKLTDPLPLPLAAVVIVIQLLLLDADHGHPLPVVIFVNPVPPLAVADMLVDERLNVQLAPACVTVNT
jgi:hypothetical protein